MTAYRTAVQARAHNGQEAPFSVCVFCGSRTGVRPLYSTLATALGHRLAAARIRLVYGGGSIGLMGVLARAALERGGTVTGVIPRFLEKMEVAQTGLSELVRVTSMHERKAHMASLANAFVALPGGTGTLDELIETTTWAQLGLHDKPIFLLGPADYWRPLRALIDHMVAEGFAARDTASLMRHPDGLDALMPALEALRGTSATASGTTRLS
ncbi:MAG: TIGR00730 family Rossman fold protein [Alphaproteobacteria bacterium]|nr:MAG: TIGR00730 family Rossman fold protein [Alphaproteobacteria bacterium]